MNKVYRVIGKIPADYRNRIDWQYAVTDFGYDKYDELIADRLPDDVYWCGDDFLAPTDWRGEMDVEEIIADAADAMMALGEFDARIWAE